MLCDLNACFFCDPSFSSSLVHYHADGGDGGGGGGDLTFGGGGGGLGFLIGFGAVGSVFSHNPNPM